MPIAQILKGCKHLLQYISDAPTYVKLEHHFSLFDRINVQVFHRWRHGLGFLVAIHHRRWYIDHLSWGTHDIFRLSAPKDYLGVNKLAKTRTDYQE